MTKLFKDSDIITTVSPINETVVISRRFLSGGASGPGSVNNIASPYLWISGAMSGGLYLTIYDRDTDEFPRQKLCSVTFGCTTSSVEYVGGTNQDEKLRMYSLFAQTLLGNKDQLFRMGEEDRHSLIFVSVHRNIFKDEMKNSEELYLTTRATGAFDDSTDNERKLLSNNIIRKFFGGRAVGLASGSSTTKDRGREAGLCFLDRGIFVIDPNRGIGTGSGGGKWSGSLDYESLALNGGTFDELLFGVRHRISEIGFKNESRMRTTFYSCTAEEEEFNYSSNPSYLDGTGRIRVTSGSSGDLKARTYLTTIALKNDNEEVIALAKLRRPVKKESRNQLVITVRLDY